MRKTIGGYFLVFSVLVSLSVPLSAAPKGGGSGESFFTRLRNAIVRMLDDAKIVIPPG